MSPRDHGKSGRGTNAGTQLTFASSRFVCRIDDLSFDRPGTPASSRCSRGFFAGCWRDGPACDCDDDPAEADDEAPAGWGLRYCRVFCFGADGMACGYRAFDRCQSVLLGCRAMQVRCDVCMCATKLNELNSSVTQSRDEKSCVWR